MCDQIATGVAAIRAQLVKARFDRHAQACDRGELEGLLIVPIVVCAPFNRRKPLWASILRPRPTARPYRIPTAFDIAGDAANGTNQVSAMSVQASD